MDLGTLFGAIGALSRGLPGYVQGQEAARQANWQDLLQTEQTRQARLANFITEATFEPTVAQHHYAGQNAYMNALLNALMTGQAVAAHPGAVQAARISGTFAPIQAMLGGAAGAAQRMQFLPGFGLQQQAPNLHDIMGMFGGFGGVPQGEFDEDFMGPAQQQMLPGFTQLPQMTPQLQQAPAMNLPSITRR